MKSPNGIANAAPFNQHLDYPAPVSFEGFITFGQVLRPTANDFIPIFDFKRFWIAVQPKVPTDDLGVDPNKIINELEKDDFYSLAADINLSPNLEATDPITPFISQGAWSCKGMVNYGRCILATLTNTGLVNLYYLRNSKWNMCLVLSQSLREHLNKCWENDPRDLSSLSASRQFSYLKKRVLQVKISAIGWSQVFSEASAGFSYFLTGHANGDIMIWKMPALSGEQSQIEPTFVTSFNSKLMRLTCLFWLSLSESKGVLIAGDLSGIIKLFILRLNPENAVDMEMLDYVDIWPDPDNIPVKMLKCLSNGPDLIDKWIAAVKGNFFIVISLNNDGTLANRASLHVGKFNVSGCEILDSTSVVLASQNGSMAKVSMAKAKSGEIDFDVTELTSNIDVSDKLCHGLGASRNKMFWIMVNSIYKPFDHLVLRDPTTAVLFTMGFISDPLTALSKNPSLSLTKYWDCVETLRILVARGRYMKTEVNTENLLSQSTYQLCCNLWMYQIFSKYQCQGNELSEEMCKTIERLENAIVAQHAIQVLQKLSSCDLKCLSEPQLLSFGLFYKWMKIYTSSCNEETQHIKSLLDTISSLDDFSLLPMTENCNFCGEMFLRAHVEMKHWKNAQCDADVSRVDASCQGSGHCIPRCSISLLQCSSLPYRTCSVCQALANKNLAVLFIFMEEYYYYCNLIECVHSDDPMCIFCHGILQLDDRL